MIIYSGVDLSATELKSLEERFILKQVNTPADAITQDLLGEAGVILLGPYITNPVKEVQKIYAADKHLSVVLLSPPANFKQVKQSVQFSPFVGKNTLIVAINPELNLTTICENAITRTKQKRSFSKIKFNEEALSNPDQKTKLAQMGTFLEHAPIGAVLLNESEKIVNYNQQFKKLFSSADLIDIELGQLFTKEVSGTIKTFLYDGHDPELKKELEVKQKIFELTATEVYNEEGQKHFLLLFNDITVKRLEAQRIHSILEALPQMAWTSSADGNATYFTQGWYFYTGQTKEEALGMGWSSVVYPEDAERLGSLWQASLSTGKPFQQAARYKKQSGEYRWHLARASAIKNNAQEIVMWVGTCTDIHDQVLLTEELERKVKERTHSLEMSNNELEQFAHVSSHDLQEPLRKIRTFVDLIKRSSEESLDDNSRRYINKISATAERMSDSLKALLNFTRLHREEKFVPVDLNEVLRNVMIDLELLISQKGAVIKTDDLQTIAAIPIQIQQLFYNLINNALKFSKKDTPPEIHIGYRQLPEQELLKFAQLNRFKDYCEIVVKDNGIGFDQNHAERIFTIFQRLHNRNEFEGTGIGLSLVKKMVDNHKGTIYAVSQPGKGAAFHIILPLG